MIELKGIWKSYGSHLSGFKHQNLTIPSGQIVGVLGENGSGKTTLLKTIMGLGELQEGQILFDGEPIAKQYERVAFITEEGSFFPNMTPNQYADFLQIFYPGFDLKRYNELLHLFKLSPSIRIRTFSKGQKSKLEIAAGFSKGAQYILMDEPFLGNDLQTRQDFLKFMLATLSGDETILIATHFIQEIEQIIDRALILRYGRIVRDVLLDDLREQGHNLEQVMNEVARYDDKAYKKLIPKDFS